MGKRGAAKLELPEQNNRVKKDTSKIKMEAVEFDGKVNHVKTTSVPVPKIQAPGDAIVCSMFPRVTFSNAF